MVVFPDPSNVLLSLHSALALPDPLTSQFRSLGWQKINQAERMQYLSIDLMNKIESAKNLLSTSRTKAAREKSRIIISGEGSRREKTPF